MEDNQITALQDKIIEALKVTAQELIGYRKRNHQKNSYFC